MIAVVTDGATRYFPDVLPVRDPCRVGDGRAGDEDPRSQALAIVPHDLRSILEDSEVPLALARAQVPKARTGYMTFAPLGLLAAGYDAARGRRDRKALRETSTALGFPLDRRLAFVVTDKRMLIFRRERARRFTLLGGVDRNRIEFAQTPFVGGGWKVTEVALVDGLRVRFLVDRRDVEGLVAALSPPATETTGCS